MVQGADEVFTREKVTSMVPAAPWNPDWAIRSWEGWHVVTPAVVLVGAGTVVVVGAGALVVVVVPVVARARELDVVARDPVPPQDASNVVARRPANAGAAVLTVVLLVVLLVTFLPPAQLRARRVLDGDAVADRGRALRQAEPEDAVLQLGLARLGVDLAWQREAVIELRGSPRAAPLGFLFHAAGDAQVVALHLDGHVLWLDTRHVGFDQVGVVSLLDVHRRRPCVDADPSHVGEDVGEQAAHLFGQVLEGGEGVPQPCRASGASSGQCHGSSL